MELMLLTFVLVSSPLYAHGSAGEASALPWYGLISFNLLIMSLAYRKGFQRKAAEKRLPFLFFTGIVATIAALFPPIDRLSEELLSVHMIQHMLLMMVAAPLFVFSYADFFIRLGLPKAMRRTIWKGSRFFVSWNIHRLSRPLFIAFLYASILWIWHLPYLYQAALRDRAIHNLEHLAFFLVSCFFWKVLLSRSGRPALNPGAGILYLFVAGLHSAALGALMTLSPKIFYPFYEGKTLHHGMSAAVDQQLAGSIMWMPAGLSFLIVAMILAYQILEPAEGS